VTPRDYAVIAKRAYSEHTLGLANTASRALVVGQVVAFPGSDNQIGRAHV
jgi:hypothetical protein